LMGPTESTKAPPGTIRASFGASIERNAVHGSDAPDTARFELGWMFAGADLGLSEPQK
jgi:nucleoside-diphosphate kinase